MSDEEKRLKDQLAMHLGWDPIIIDSVAQNITQAQSLNDVKDIVENFMEGNQPAIQAIHRYMDARNKRSATPAAAPAPQTAAAAVRGAGAGPSSSTAGGGGKGDKGGGGPRGATPGYLPQVAAPPSRRPPHQQQPQPQPQQQSSAAPPAAAAGSDDKRWLRLGQDAAAAGGGGGGGAGSAAAAQQRDPDVEAAAAAASMQAAQATLAMFRKGGKIKARTGKGKDAPGEGSDPAAALERPVVNCLGCGKIYDCRALSNDVLDFLKSGGTCTFCGSKVALTYRGAPPAIVGAPPPPEAAAAAAAAASGAGAAPAVAADAQAAAEEFKNRLVEYDRNSAKRTAVIDDQSDFFEIDTNAWLTDEERQELRRRKRLEEEAAAARRGRVTVTLDLLGRKVLVHDKAAGAPAAEGTGITLGADAPYSVPTGTSAGPPQPCAGQAAAAGDGAPPPRSAEEAAASAEAVARAAKAIRELKISACPNLGRPAPKFVARGTEKRAGGEAAGAAKEKGSKRTGPAREQQQQQPQRQGPKQQQGSAAAAGAEALPQRVPRGGGRKAARRSAEQQQRRGLSSRVQDEDAFVEFEADLIYDEVSAAGGA